MMRKHILIVVCLLVITPLLCIYTSNISERIIGYVYTSIMHTRLVVTLDDDGVPINDYQYTEGVYIGKQRYPITIAQRALVCWDKDDVYVQAGHYYPFDDKPQGYDEQGFLNCAKWIVNNTTSHDDYVVWETNFPSEHYNLTAPWRSAMAQGQCIQVLVRAYKVTGDDNYLELARKALNAFYVEVENGGVTLKGDGGWWYEEYADEGGANPRVLNGHIFALEGIYEYYAATNDAEAKYLFDMGILALKTHLPDYDSGTWTYYDTLGEMATEGYHKLHITQMSHLYDLTNDSVFQQYYKRWKDYRPTIFPLRLIKEPTTMNLAIYLSNFLIYLLIAEMTIVLVSIARRRKTESPRRTR
jgi:heparosan-N-sulfate-glucuronate 5-epimerase